jgi:hypothetical protein
MRIGGEPLRSPSSRFTPTTPARMMSPIERPTASGVSPKPPSMSAVTGTATARAMRAVWPTTSSHGAASPSG